MMTPEIAQMVEEGIKDRSMLRPLADHLMEKNNPMLLIQVFEMLLSVGLIWANKNQRARDDKAFKRQKQMDNAIDNGISD